MASPVISFLISRQQSPFKCFAGDRWTFFLRPLSLIAVYNAHKYRQTLTHTHSGMLANKTNENYCYLLISTESKQLQQWPKEKKKYEGKKCPKKISKS